MTKNKKIALAYVGAEQPSWGLQAFHAPRHYYVMPGILYLAAVVRDNAGAASAGDVDCRYLNRSVQSFDEMVAALLSGEPDLIGLSCYSWNVGQSLSLAAACKRSAPSVKIMLGGPGVFFNDPVESKQLFRESPAIDAVVIGEGERVVCKVASALLGSAKEAPVENAALRLGGEIVCGPRVDKPIDLSLLPEIDPTGVEAPRSPGTGLAAVCQTYRGCPFRCSYCGFPGGMKGIRRFPVDRIERELKKLFDAKVDLISFADSVLDLTLDRAKEILTICIEHNKETSLHCYAAFQRMDDELADLFERSGIQVGIGLQSMRDTVLREVSRHGFSVDRFKESMRVFGERKVNYYVDLMFGLPGDDMIGFRTSVNEVMELGAPFIMPFPLTVIPSSEIAKNPSKFGVVKYGSDLIKESVRPVSGMVYAEIGLFKQFDLSDLRRFDDVATAVFFAMQRYPRTVRRLVDRARIVSAQGRRFDAFDLLERIGLVIRSRIGEESVDATNPPAIEVTLRQALADLFAEMGASDSEIEGLGALMRLDSAVAAMIDRTDRRSAYRAVKKRREERRAQGVPDEPANETVAFTAPNKLLSLPALCGDIGDPVSFKERSRGDEILAIASAPYDRWRAEIFELSCDEWAICEHIPPCPKEIRLVSVLRRAQRLNPDLSWRPAMERLISCGLIELFVPKAEKPGPA